jgi:hypothetical protein
MIKLDTNSLSLAYASDSYKGLESTRRLIVLVPDDSNYTTMTHRIWELANALGCQILFLSLYADEAQESSQRRQLITMSAMIQDGNVRVETRVETGSNWVNAVRAYLHDGDMIVCFAEQRIGLLHRPLSQILQSNLNAPVYIFPGLYPKSPSQSTWRSQIMAWLGSIGIIVGAFLLQIRIASMPADWVQTALLILSLTAEIWLIGGWNSLFG